MARIKEDRRRLTLLLKKRRSVKIKRLGIHITSKFCLFTIVKMFTRVLLIIWLVLLFNSQTLMAEKSDGNFGIRGLSGKEVLHKAPSLAKKDGISWTRIAVYWNQIEHEKRRFRWQELDEVMSQILSNEINVMVTIRSYSKWASKKATVSAHSKNTWLEHKAGSFPESENVVHYKDFLKALVERYDGDDDFGKDAPGKELKNLIIKKPIKYWQIENEPGSCDINQGSSFWNGTAKELAELFMIATDSIKQADPQAKLVLSGFTAKTFIQCDGVYPDLILKTLRDKGYDFDIFDIHNYRDVDTITKQVSGVKKLLRKYGFTKTKIWMTESDANVRYFRLSMPEDQYDKYRSVEIIKKHVTAFSEGVEKVFQWTFSDSAKWPPRKRNEITKFRGIVRSDFSLKPIYSTYKLMISKLDGFTSCSNLSKGSVKVYKFMVGSQPVYVAWDDKGGKEFSLDIGEAKITNINGKEAVKDSSKILLSSAPVFIERFDRKNSSVSFPRQLSGGL